MKDYKLAITLFFDRHTASARLVALKGLGILNNVK